MPVIRYNQALYEWKTATAAFAIGAYDDASVRFMDAAEKLIVSRTDPQTHTFQAGRCMAYENAGVALKGAHHSEEVRARLERMYVGDIGCLHSLRRILGKKPPPKRIGPIRTTTTSSRP